MTKFYEYGIDLGTTNSCISKLSDNQVRIYKNRDNMNVTPSAVYILGKREFVGKAAITKMLENPENGVLAFKRTMGTDALFDFNEAKVKKSSIELSTLILKSMANDVYKMEQMPVENAIITVPAAFGTLQCDATYRAGVEAGFKNVLLLQEPIAAAVAYAQKENSKNQYWLVYDFGGGTFDIAVVSTFDERLTILNHEGNNHLGGKDIDELILKRYIIPAYDDADNYIDFDNKIIRSRLLFEAERTKEDLSTLEKVNLIIDGDEIFGDESLSKTITIARSEFEEEIEGVIEKTLKLTEKAIHDSGISKDKFTKIVLVGGTTFIPAVRNSLKERFGIPLDFSLDPMTVVSEGAAIFGASKKVDNIEQETSNVIDSGEVTMQLEYDALTPELITSIIGKVFGVNEEHVEYKIDDNAGFYTSGWKNLESGNIIDADVQLRPDTLNIFGIVLRTSKGVNIIPRDNSFSIRHQKDVLLTSAPPIPMSFCIEVDSEGNSELIPLIKKGISLPAKSVKTFKAAKTIASGSDDFIAIKVWEGEQFKYPTLNNWVGILKIEGKQLSKTIVAGQEIDVTIRLDESRRVYVSAAVTELGIFLQKDQIYETVDFDYKTKFDEVYVEIQSIIDEMSDWESESKGNEIISLLDEFKRLSDDFDAHSYSEYEDADRAIKLMHEYNELKKSYFALAELVNHEVKKADRVQDIERISNAIKDFGSKEEKEIFTQLHNAYENSNGVNDEKQRDTYYTKMSELRLYVLWGNFDFVHYMYHDLLNENPHFTDRMRAIQLKKDAENAITRKSVSDLREALFGLYDLLHVDSRNILNEKDLPSGLKL